MKTTRTATKFKRNKKCSKTGKSKFPTEQAAGRAMMRIWSHDTSANIYDLHTYLCEHCGHWHIGHISYYEKGLAKRENTHGNNLSATTKV